MDSHVITVFLANGVEDAVQYLAVALMGHSMKQENVQISFVVRRKESMAAMNAMI